MTVRPSACIETQESSLAFTETVNCLASAEEGAGLAGPSVLLFSLAVFDEEFCLPVAPVERFCSGVDDAVGGPLPVLESRGLGSDGELAGPEAGLGAGGLHGAEEGVDGVMEREPAKW